MDRRADLLRLQAMAIDMAERIGNRLRARREELGLSRPRLAKMLPGSVDANQIYKWEKGLHRPQDDTLQALAEVLEVDVSYFHMAEPEAGTPDLMGALSDGSQLDRVEAKLDLVLRRLAAGGIGESSETG